MLKILECDLTDHTVVYPNSLKREHDKASRKVAQVQDKLVAKRFRERAAENEWCIWENDLFKVVVPHEVTELYEEGRMLHHCVGSYGGWCLTESVSLRLSGGRRKKRPPFAQ